MYTLNTFFGMYWIKVCIFKKKVRTLSGTVSVRFLQAGELTLAYLKRKRTYISETLGGSQNNQMNLTTKPGSEPRTQAAELAGEASPSTDTTADISKATNMGHWPERALDMPTLKTGWGQLLPPGVLVLLLIGMS